MRKRNTARIASCVMALVMAASPVTVSAENKNTEPEEAREVAYTLYVAPDGSDENDGSADSPFQTIAAAKEAVRGLDKSKGDIVVKIADGFYSLDETLEFGPEDSGNENCTIYYEAEDGAEPVISGGDKITGEWTLHDGEKNIWKVPLDRDHKLRALYVNGERSYMANTGNSIWANGQWGTYTIGPVYNEEDYEWKEIFSDDFSDREAGTRIGQDDETYELYAKSGNLENSIVNVVEVDDGNKMLQIAHTANEDAGFTVKCDPYENALIELDYQFAPDLVFNNVYESLQIQGWYKDPDNWNSFVLEKDMYYMQNCSSGSSSGRIGTVSQGTEKGVWYHSKTMILDGRYFTKIWKDGTQEPDSWTLQNEMPVSGEGGSLRVYAYKGGDNSNMDILIDNIRISELDGNLSDTAGSAMPDWAWAEGTKFDGIKYSKNDLPEITRNVEDVEIENQQTWNKNTVCVREIEDAGDGNWILKLQQPYGAIAQTPGWGVALYGSGSHIIHNAYELLDAPGEFYFDKTEQMLYYIPRENEDLSSAEVIVPEVETLVDFKGDPTASGDMSTAGRKEITGQTEYITMKGLTFAHSDWGLQKVGDSYGKSTVQAGTVYTAYSTDNWHYDMYRNLDTMPGAVQMEFAHHISILDGAVMLTGAEGVNMKNDVEDCEVSGNYFYQTGGSAVIVGNPQHIYENDSLEPDVYVHRVDQKPENEILGATADKEKYQDGLEAIPRNDRIADNIFYECAQLFPSNVTITSFYTENLQVEHNLLKDTAYSGMSIGWGWCNFDGKPDGFNDWGTLNNQGGSVLPGYPTETCRENKILNNRIDDTMRILADGGSIYTLGKQDGTRIEENYIRNTEKGALYQDEGSADFAPIKNNVISGSMIASIDAGEYGRKHNLHYVDNYSTINNNLIPWQESINITNENFHYVEDGAWDLDVYKIALSSGPEKKYIVKYADLLGSAYNGIQNVVLPSSVRITGGQMLPVMGCLSAEDRIWLAPEGTQEFTEGETMTCAAGNADEIMVPISGGDLKLYVQYADGTVSAASDYTVRAEDGNTRLSSEDITLYVKGAPQYQLEIRNLPEGAQAAWSSDDPDVAAVDDSGLVTAVSEGGAVITASVGEQQLQCAVTVKSEAEVPVEDLSIWLAADQGVTLAEDGTSVAEWKSQADTDFKVAPSSEASAPKLVTDDNGKMHIQFDGTDDYLKTEGVDFNNKSEMTIVAVSKYTGEERGSEQYGDAGSVLFVTESGSWGSLYLSPFYDWVAMRFGSGAENCHVIYNRPERMEERTVTMAVKNGTTEMMYVDGTKVLEKAGQAGTTANNGNELYIGTGISNGTLYPYEGYISEILVYDRALTDEEAEELTVYLNAKYNTEDEEEPEESVDKKTLEFFLNSAKALLADGSVDGCVQSVRELFQEAVAEGEVVMADENATREEVQSAAFKLMKAVHAVNMKAADKTFLEMAAELAYMIDLEDYVTAGQQEFTDALAAAETVIADGDAMQAETEAAWERLTAAMDNLRMKADKSVLEDLIREMEDLDLSMYTEESAAQFSLALASAQAVFADNELSFEDQQAVDSAAAELRNARAALVLKEEENGDGSDVQDPGENADHNSSAAPVDKAAKTGDGSTAAGLLALLVLAGVSGMAAVITVRKKER